MMGGEGHAYQQTDWPETSTGNFDLTQLRQRKQRGIAAVRKGRGTSALVPQPHDNGNEHLS